MSAGSSSMISSGLAGDEPNLLSDGIGSYGEDGRASN
jgi:hypothetical protein